MTETAYAPASPGARNSYTVDPSANTVLKLSTAPVRSLHVPGKSGFAVAVTETVTKAPACTGEGLPVIPRRVQHLPGRSGGTRGYRSRHVEETGIFRVLDDYIALVRTCFRGFPFPYFGCDSDVLAPLSYLLDAFSNRATPEDTDLEICYLEAFEIFCSEIGQTDPTRCTLDPAYMAALPIQAVIAAKLQ
jgi:hypothetical protein